MDGVRPPHFCIVTRVSNFGVVLLKLSIYLNQTSVYLTKVTQVRFVPTGVLPLTDQESTAAQPMLTVMQWCWCRMMGLMQGRGNLRISLQQTCSPEE
jgi:hypothetical protein